MAPHTSRTYDPSDTYGDLQNKNTTHESVSIRAAVGIAVASSAGTALLCVLLWYVLKRRNVLQKAQARNKLATTADTTTSAPDSDAIRIDLLHEPHDCPQQQQQDQQQLHAHTAPAQDPHRAPNTPLAPRPPDTVHNVPTSQDDCWSHRSTWTKAQNSPSTVSEETPQVRIRGRRRRSSSSPRTIKEPRKTHPTQEDPAQGDSSDTALDCTRRSSSKSTATQANNIDKAYTPSVYRFAPPESIAKAPTAPPNLTTEYSTASLSAFREFAPWVVYPAGTSREDGWAD